jgi:hypothetical protein
MVKRFKAFLPIPTGQFASLAFGQRARHEFLISS